MYEWVALKFAKLLRVFPPRNLIPTSWHGQLSQVGIREAERERAVWFTLGRWRGDCDNSKMAKIRPVYCGNFEYDARQSEIERLFTAYGRVDRVDMKTGNLSSLALGSLSHYSPVLWSRSIIPHSVWWLGLCSNMLSFSLHFNKLLFQPVLDEAGPINWFWCMSSLSLCLLWNNGSNMVVLW